MIISYNKNIKLYDVQVAMNEYVVIYNNFNYSTADHMLWPALKTDICSKYSVADLAKSSDIGHAVVAYGFTLVAGTPYVAMWNQE